MFDWKRCVAFVLQPATKEGDDEISLLSLYRVDLCCRSHSVVFYLWSLLASALSISLFFLGARACAFFFSSAFPAMLPSSSLSLVCSLYEDVIKRGPAVHCTSMQNDTNRQTLHQNDLNFFYSSATEMILSHHRGTGNWTVFRTLFNCFALSAKCLIVFYKQWF